MASSSKSVNQAPIPAAEDSDIEEMDSNDFDFESSSKKARKMRSSFKTFIPKETKQIPFEKKAKFRAKCSGCSIGYEIKKKSNEGLNEIQQFIQFYQHMISDCPAYGALSKYIWRQFNLI